MNLTVQDIEIIVRVHKFFQDYRKTAIWLSCPNLNLGNLSPIQLMQVGRGHRVLEFIIDAEQESQGGEIEKENHNVIRKKS